MRSPYVCNCAIVKEPTLSPIPWYIVACGNDPNSTNS